MPDFKGHVAGDQLEACLLGCAVGDSLGLPYEGLRPARLAKILKTPLAHRFLFGKGMVSDDTDHTIFVAQALARHPCDPDAFARCLAGKLRLWLLCVPAGIGLATLKSILKLWVGFSPKKSGVFSAGNGAAMRSAIIGTFFSDDPTRRRQFVSASTHITHSDPKANFGAQAVAEIAALCANQNSASPPPIETLTDLLNAISDDVGWRHQVRKIAGACESGHLESALSEGAHQRGVSGYIYHTLPVAIAAWYLHHGNFRATVETAISLGGDTDTVAAIAGSLAGITSGRNGIPADWIAGIVDRPHSPGYLHRLASALAKPHPSTWGMSPLLFPRGIVFTTAILFHGFRRLFPPYAKAATLA